MLYVYQYHDLENDIEINVKAKNALSAAKKIWRQIKSLSIFDVTNIDTKETISFDASVWSRYGKFLQ